MKLTDEMKASLKAAIDKADYINLCGETADQNIYFDVPMTEILLRANGVLELWHNPDNLEI